MENNENPRKITVPHTATPYQYLPEKKHARCNAFSVFVQNVTKLALQNILGTTDRLTKPYKTLCGTLAALQNAPPSYKFYPKTNQILTNYIPKHTTFLQQHFANS